MAMTLTPIRCPNCWEGQVGHLFCLCSSLHLSRDTSKPLFCNMYRFKICILYRFKIDMQLYCIQLYLKLLYYIHILHLRKVIWQDLNHLQILECSIRGPNGTLSQTDLRKPLASCSQTATSMLSEMIPDRWSRTSRTERLLRYEHMDVHRGLYNVSPYA